VIYDDLCFTARLDPRRPGQYMIVAYPPDGFRLRRNHKTGVLNCLPEPEGKRSECPSEKEVQEIAARAESIRAEAMKRLRDHDSQRYSERAGRPVPRTGKLDREELWAAGVARGEEELETVGNEPE
jgi:hypothetical protein